MDLSNQINKLRILNQALSDPSHYLTRVVTNNDNTPFLCAGDLVAFTLAPVEKIGDISDNEIYLFIYNNHELIGYLKDNIIFTLNSKHPIEHCLSAHRLLFISK